MFHPVLTAEQKQLLAVPQEAMHGEGRSVLSSTCCCMLGFLGQTSKLLQSAALCTYWVTALCSSCMKLSHWPRIRKRVLSGWLGFLFAMHTHLFISNCWRRNSQKLHLPSAVLARGFANSLHMLDGSCFKSTHNLSKNAHMFFKQFLISEMISEIVNFMCISVFSV